MQAFVEFQSPCSTGLPLASAFSSVAEDSEFFVRGSTGYSVARKPDCCDGLELPMSGWQVEPLENITVKSSYWDDAARFPSGTIEFDCALLMRAIEHEWWALPVMRQSAPV